MDINYLTLTINDYNYIVDKDKTLFFPLMRIFFPFLNRGLTYRQPILFELYPAPPATPFLTLPVGRDLRVKYLVVSLQVKRNIVVRHHSPGPLSHIL